MNLYSAKPQTVEFAHPGPWLATWLMEMLPGKPTFHPGNHVGQGVDEAFALSAVLTRWFEDEKTTVLLETMAGKGSEVELALPRRS